MDGHRVAVLGTASGPVLSARLARSGDLCCLLVNGCAQVHRPYPCGDAATRADPGALRAHLALLPQLAAAGLVRAAKDVGMDGVVLEA
jgi:selenophosphate synthetase-related protein